MSDLKHSWARHCAVAGAILTVSFWWFIQDAEEPWREPDRAVVTGKWLQVDMPGRRARHWAAYEYEANGRTYRGEYQCDGGCFTSLRERPTPGTAMVVEYRLEDPAVSRPGGLVTEGAARYRRAGLAISIGLLAIGMLGLALGTSRRPAG